MSTNQLGKPTSYLTKRKVQCKGKTQGVQSTKDLHSEVISARSHECPTTITQEQ